MKKIYTIFFIIFTSTSLLAQKESTSPKEKKESSLPESFLNLDLNYASNQDITSSPFVLKAMIGSKNSGIIVGFQACTFAYEQELLSDEFEVTAEYLNAMYGQQYWNFSNIQSKGGNSYLVGDSLEGDYDLNGISLRLGYQKSIFKGLYANISADLTKIKTNVYNQTAFSFDCNDYFGNEYSINENISELQRDRTILGWRLNTGIGYTFSFGRAKKIYLNTEMVYSVINKSKTIEGNMSLMAGLGFRFGTPAKTTYDNEIKTKRGGRTIQP